MANTRFNYDTCRTIKKIQQSTDPGRWILNVPGNGSAPCYIEDPQIIIQKWGANLRTNTINLESELLGVNRQLNKDCLGKDNYVRYNVPSEPIKYPNCNNLFTEQSRVIMPAWTARDLEQVDWYYPPLNPQENVCLPFQNNLNTRILEKNCFERNRTCLNNDINNELPNNFLKGSYVAGPNVCTQQNSCEKISKK
jgi:hypothetical protein